MKLEDLISQSGLEEKHYQLKEIKAPLIEASLYTTLGRRLFELYQKYNISAEDQRDFEKLNFLLMSFVLSRSLQKPNLWDRFRSLWNAQRSSK